MGEERGGPPLAAPPGLGAPRPFLCFPAAGPRPRAGPGDGGRGVARARVRGRRRAAPPFPSPGGGRAGPGGRRREPVAAVTRVRAGVPSLCLVPGGGDREDGTRASAWPSRAPFLPGRGGSTSRPARPPGTLPPALGRWRGALRVDQPAARHSARRALCRRPLGGGGAPRVDQPAGPPARHSAAGPWAVAGRPAGRPALSS